MTLQFAVSEALLDIVGREHVRLTPSEVADYSRHGMPMPMSAMEAVVYPGGTDDVAAIVRGSAATGIPVTVQGTGLNAGGVDALGSPGIVLDLRRLNQILKISSDEFLARVQPEVTTAALSAAAAATGLRYCGPGADATTASTIAGALASSVAERGSMEGAIAGSHVLGLDAVLPTGHIVRSGQRRGDQDVLDVAQLLAWRARTRAVITELTVVLLPEPRGTPGLAYFATLGQGCRAVAAITTAGVAPACLALLDLRAIAVGDLIGFGLRRDARALLICHDDGPAHQVASRMEWIRDICHACQAVETKLADEVGAPHRRLLARIKATVDPRTILELHRGSA